MKRIIIIISVLLVLIFSVSAMAGDDPFDLSQYQKDTEGLNDITKESVQKIAEEAKILYENGEYKKAEIQLQLWAKSANYLANIISSGLEPFYGASYDDRKEFPYTKLKVFIPYEGLANNLKADRNHAMVMRAEALVKLDREGEAIALYRKALDLIDIEDWDWWIRATNGLYRIVNIDIIEYGSK